MNKPLTLGPWKEKVRYADKNGVVHTVRMRQDLRSLRDIQFWTCTGVTRFLEADVDRPVTCLRCLSDAPGPR